MRANGIHPESAKPKGFATGFGNGGQKSASAGTNPPLTGHPPPDAYAVSFRVRLWRQISPNHCHKGW